MTRQTRKLAVKLPAALLAALAVTACGQSPEAPAAAGRGGTLVATVRNEPQSYNRLTARIDTTNVLLSQTLTQASLVRINPISDEVEPWLATSWSRRG